MPPQTIAPSRALGVREAGEAELARWDELVAGFPNHRMLQDRAWVESLAAAGLGRPLYLIFERAGQVVAGWPGQLATMAGGRLFGSPLPGRQTESMGPAFDPERVTTDELLGALIPFLEERHRVRYLEVVHPGLDGGAMRRAGFVEQPVATYRAPLHPGDARRQLAALPSVTRRNIRRAERLGLEVRFPSDDQFVSRHVRQVEKVFHRRGASLPFDERRVAALVRHLGPAGRLVAVEVCLPGGRVSIASGIFLMDQAELLLWTWAHDPHYRWYRATELMTWAVIERAVEAGCSSFDLAGGGDFKKKFGAELDQRTRRWIRTRPRWLLTARSVAERGYRLQQRARGSLRRLVDRSGAPSAPAPEPSAAARERPAVVWGDVDLVHTLAAAGIASAVVAPPGAPARLSRFTRAKLPWHDPLDRPEAMLDALLRYAEAEPSPPLLCPGHPESIAFVAAHRDRLEPLFRFSIPDTERLDDLLDRWRLHTLATRLELPVPAAVLLSGWRGEAGADPPRYPALLEPRRPGPSWRRVIGARDTIYLEGPEALRRVWPGLAAAGLEAVARELIPGPVTRREAYSAYVDRKGNILGEATGRVLRDDPARSEGPTALEVTETADVRSLGASIVRRLRIRGLVTIELARGAEDRLYLLRVCPWVTPWIHAAARAGTNLPALLHDDLSGLSPATATIRAGLRWCDPWRDRIAARRAGIWFPDWLLWTLGTEAKHAWAWNDPVPALATLVGRLRSRAALPRAHRPATRAEPATAPQVP